MSMPNIAIKRSWLLCVPFIDILLRCIVVFVLISFYELNIHNMHKRNGFELNCLPQHSMSQIVDFMAGRSRMAYVVLLVIALADLVSLPLLVLTPKMILIVRWCGLYWKHLPQEKIHKIIYHVKKNSWLTKLETITIFDDSGNLIYVEKHSNIHNEGIVNLLYCYYFAKLSACDLGPDPKSDEE